MSVCIRALYTFMNQGGDLEMMVAFVVWVCALSLGDDELNWECRLCFLSCDGLFTGFIIHVVMLIYEIEVSYVGVFWSMLKQLVVRRKTSLWVVYPLMVDSNCCLHFHHILYFSLYASLPSIDHIPHFLHYIVSIIGKLSFSAL